ncbi:WXG100 family type VII secretion target [Amycolatopsis rhizosphaerae]|uniref:WXG100 family type VII secretion target n=1 Tax=Amycolatopsis rhizosphaerae TaxID=2053003 RepID=A0A557ZSD3_9PSEU|nr:WXG100 family type VII secretion target [Amycolatopsis rhizosphaerae]TVT14927.1 WXG100 family type VII secretion target [Amycolatopsis rhizosphaerae]
MSARKESGGFTTDPDAVLSSARGLRDAADQLREAGQALGSALAAQGECWGDDESGKEFAKDYVPGAKGATEAFGSLTEALTSLYENIAAAMEQYSGADGQVRTVLQKGQ